MYSNENPNLNELVVPPNEQISAEKIRNENEIQGILKDFSVSEKIKMELGISSNENPVILIHVHDGDDSSISCEMSFPDTGELLEITGDYHRNPNYLEVNVTNKTTGNAMKLNTQELDMER